MPKAKRKAKKPAAHATRASDRAEARSFQMTTQEVPDDGNSPVIFWKEAEREVGFLSPWYKCKFKESGVKYDSVGHLILAEKARLYGDKV